MAAPPPAAAQDSGAPAPAVSRGRTKIVILGSLGGQQISQLTGANVRCGTSVLFDVDGVLLVVDCGCGSVHRIAEAGYDLDALRYVLVTHHHADHVAELGAMATFAWSSGRNGGEPHRRLDVFGPTGTRDYEQGFKRSLRRSIHDQETALGQKPTFAKFAHWHEFAPPRSPRRVLKDKRFDVHAARVDHGGLPAVGYRIRTPDLDVALSGDRGPKGDRFPMFAKGADALFHEIIDLDIVLPALEQQHVAQTFIDHLVNDHCDPKTVGKTATAAGVKTLVLYHLIPGNPGITDESWVSQVSPHYSGRIIVGRDLLVV
jgi:ribonuclease BN (tRNA processing enzyme)